jgi:hypothetical protein
MTVGSVCAGIGGFDIGRPDLVSPREEVGTMTCRDKVRVVDDPNGWRIVVYIRGYRFQSEVFFTRKYEAAKAAETIAQGIGAEYVPPSEPTLSISEQG